MLKKLSASGVLEPLGPLVALPSVQVPAAVIRSSCPALTLTPVFTQPLAGTDFETAVAAAGALGAASARVDQSPAVSSGAMSRIAAPLTSQRRGPARIFHELVPPAPAALSFPIGSLPQFGSGSHARPQA